MHMSAPAFGQTTLSYTRKFHPRSVMVAGSSHRCVVLCLGAHLAIENLLWTTHNLHFSWVFHCQRPVSGHLRTRIGHRISRSIYGMVNCRQPHNVSENFRLVSNELNRVGTILGSAGLPRMLEIACGKRHKISDHQNTLQDIVARSNSQSLGNRRADGYIIVASCQDMS